MCDFYSKRLSIDNVVVICSTLVTGAMLSMAMAIGVILSITSYNEDRYLGYCVSEVTYNRTLSWMIACLVTTLLQVTTAIIVFIIA